MKYFLACLLFPFLSACNVAVKDNVPTAITVEELAKTETSWDGTALPAYDSGTPEITILKITIPAKTQLPLHKHPVINAGVLLKGNLTVITETNEELHLKTGDPIVELVNKWHYGKNEGNEPAVIIVFYAGTTNKQITIKSNTNPRLESLARS